MLQCSSSYYYYFYAAHDNNVVGLILTTPDSVDTPESEIPDEDMVDTMGDDMLEAMECKNGNICDDSGYGFREEHGIYGDTFYLSNFLKQIVEIKYTYVSLNQLMSQ